MAVEYNIRDNIMAVTMSVEDSIEKIIGRFGLYQVWIIILISLGRLPTEFHLTNVVFVIPNVDYVCLVNGVNVTNACPCDDPVYDQNTIHSSATSEWNLICKRNTLASLSISILQIGILAGSLLYGYISDKYGRKLAVLISLFFTAFFGTISSVFPYFWMFLVCRFFIGTSIGGTMLCCYVLLIELSGKSFRPYLIGIEGIAHVFGYFVQPIIAYYVRDWRYLVLITSAPWLFIVVYYWLIPESPRWLITVGKTNEAIKLLTKIAIINRRSIDNVEEMVNAIESSDKEKRGTYLDLFKTPKIRKHTIFNAIMWMCCAHTFFGLNQYIGRLDGNLHLNVMLSALCYVPGLVLVVFATLWLKRRVSVITTFSLTSISLIMIIFIPKKLAWATLTCAMIGQTSMYVAFILVYLYAAEVFPTFIRNSAMGFASVFARVGSFLAPFVVNIGIQWISMLIFASLAFAGGFVCVFLPETKDIVLMNTIDQAERSIVTNQVLITPTKKKGFLK